MIENGRRYRVAAPSIRIVPWAALASCWPLPQQLLPVSATGGGRRRCTLAIISGRIIFNFAFVALCGALQTHFHGRGRRGKRQLQRRFLRKRGAAISGLALSVTCGDSSPKGRAKSTAGSFLITLKTLATNVTAWLSLRGKTSPAPGEDVTVGDKRGNLARERLRGFSTKKAAAEAAAFLITVCVLLRSRMRCGGRAARHGCSGCR